MLLVEVLEDRTMLSSVQSVSLDLQAKANAAALNDEPSSQVGDLPIPFSDTAQSVDTGFFTNPDGTITTTVTTLTVTSKGSYSFLPHVPGSGVREGDIQFSENLQSLGFFGRVAASASASWKCTFTLDAPSTFSLSDTGLDNPDFPGTVKVLYKDPSGHNAEVDILPLFVPPPVPLVREITLDPKFPSIEIDKVIANDVNVPRTTPSIYSTSSASILHWTLTPKDHLVVTSPPSPTDDTAHTIFPNQTFDVEVSAEDASGKVDPAFNGNIIIAVQNPGANPGGGTLDGTRTLPATNGRADFNHLTLDKPGTGYTLQATNPTAGSVTTAPFDVSVETATLLDAEPHPSFIVNGFAEGIILSASVLNTKSPENGPPTGSIQFYFNGEKEGDPVELTPLTARGSIATLFEPVFPDEEGVYPIGAFYLNKDDTFLPSFAVETQSVIEVDDDLELPLS
jgi:hypothetical protein